MECLESTDEFDEAPARVISSEEGIQESWISDRVRDDTAGTARTDKEEAPPRFFPFPTSLGSIKTKLRLPRRLRLLAMARL